MEDLKKIFMLDKIKAMTLTQKLAVVIAAITFCITFLFATSANIIATTLSTVAFWLAALWVERSGVDVEE